VQVRLLGFLLFGVLLLDARASFALTPDQRLQVRHLEAVHQQRIEWSKKRVGMPLPGIYQDFRAVYARAAGFSHQQILAAAKDTEVRVVVGKVAVAPEAEPRVLFFDSPGALDPPVVAEAAGGLRVTTPKQRRSLRSKFNMYPDEVFGIPGAGGSLMQDHHAGSRSVRELEAEFGSSSTHILASDLTESSIRASLAKRRSYVAQDWLCDPAGFLFVAENFLGVFDIGDDVPMLSTRIEARLPIPANIKLLRDGVVISETNGSKLDYEVKDPGAYRLQAWLRVDGDDLLWIDTGLLRVNGTPNLTLPPIEISSNVEVVKDISYTGGDPVDAPKHKLDLYLPKDKKNFPVMLFVHGGSWRMGDRAMYPVLGNRFAKMGVGVAIPSYRLMPGNPHPAQAEDVAAAFAWVYKNVAQYGGDIKRMYLAGHSSGGHLAALLALDETYLKKFDVPATAIHGVAALSGVYDVSRVPEFISRKGAPEPSPLDHVHANAPPFLITFSQWDYFELPKQARDFAASLKKDFVTAQLLYLPGENHISELLNIWKDDDPLALAVLNFVK